MSGWVKLHRKITEWEWWDDHNATRLFIYIITKANHKDKNWRGVNIKRGQFLSSLDKLTKETGISSQKIRTAIKRLKSTNEITSESTSRYTIYTVNKYDLYQYEQQENNIQNNKPLTNGQQTTNKQVTTTNNNKNIKKVKKEKKNKVLTTDSIESNGQITLLQHFGGCFKEYFGHEYHASFGKDGKLLKQLEKHYGYDTVIKGITYFFKEYITNNEFSHENPDVGIMSVKWNSMIAQGSGKKALTKQQKKLHNSIKNIRELDLD